jgi:putative transposase
MSYVRIWVHLVFSTKNREPYLKKEIRKNAINHIIKNCSEKKIFLSAINGYDEHIHCLISLGKEQSISKVAMMIKGESSFWINQQSLTKGKFIWQDDYFAVSVSESQVSRVKKYIANQENHHTHKNFTEEVDDFLTKYGWKQLTN